MSSLHATPPLQQPSVHATPTPTPICSAGNHDMNIMGDHIIAGASEKTTTATATNPPPYNSTSTRMLNPFLSTATTSTRLMTVSNPFLSNPFVSNPDVLNPSTANPESQRPPPQQSPQSQQQSPSSSTKAKQTPPHDSSDMSMLAHLDQRLEMHDRLLQQQQQSSDQQSLVTKQSLESPTPPQPQQQPQQSRQEHPSPQQSEENNEDGDGDAVHLLPLRETTSWPLHTNILVPLFAEVQPPIAYPQPSQVQSLKQSSSPLSSPSKLMAFIRKHSM